jgi:hypothetical protein
MTLGDRVAINAFDGKGANTIMIKAIGIVKDVDEFRVYIDCVLTGMRRRVHCKNYICAIHGLVKDRGWRNEDFSI